MHKSLFNSIMGNVVHYFVCPLSESFYLNSLERVDSDTYLYRLLRDEGYKRIVMVRTTGDSWEVRTYDRLSYWSWTKPKEFAQVDTSDPDAVEQFCRKWESPQPMLRGIQGPIGAPAPAPVQKVIPAVGRCVVESFAGSNEFASFFLSQRVKPAMAAKNLKTAVVMPVEIFDAKGDDGTPFLSALAVNHFQSILAGNDELENILVLTTDNTAKLVQYVNEGRSRYWEIHPWASKIASDYPEPKFRENAIIQKLTDEGTMVLACSIYEDEIANLLLWKKLVVGDPRLKKLDISKIYPLADQIEAQCRGQKCYFKALPFKEVKVAGEQPLINRMKQLEKYLEEDAVVTELVEKAETMFGRVPKRIENLSPMMLARVTGTMVPRSERSQKEIEHERNEAMCELNDLIGMNSVKVQIRKIRNKIKQGKTTSPGHFMFKGNPGTGKTVVARIVGRIFYAFGILSQKEVVEVDRSKLVGTVIGETEQKTLEWCNRALGGVLFVDEAYELYVADSEKDYGRVALSTIMKFMEDHRDNICVIFAGYTNKLDEMLENTNVGYRERFKYHIEFPDYSADELFQIMVSMASKKGLALSPDFRETAKDLFEYWIQTKKENFGNARSVRNLLELADDNHVDRIETAIEQGMTIPEDQMNLLIAKDLPQRAPKMRPSDVTPRPPVPEYQRIPAAQLTQLPAPYSEEVCGDGVKLNAAAENAVVKLKSDNGSTATAFLISPDGYAITCDHAIAGAGRIQALLRTTEHPGCEEADYDCKLINTKEDLDIALIKLDGTNFHYLKLASADRTILKGEKYMLFGYPWGDEQGVKLNEGIISSSELTDEAGIPYIQLTGNGFHGNSGGPLLALSDGSVIGVFNGSKYRALDGQRSEEINHMRPIRLFWEEFLE